MEIDQLPKNSGIYCMYFEQIYNKVYIGCSINIHKRITDHLGGLRRNNHCNYLLQNAYNKYGCPHVEVLELCSDEYLAEKEVSYIEEFDSFYNGFNLTLGAEGRCFGENNGAAKYTEKTYKAVLFELAYTNKSCQQIADEVGVTRGIVKQISGLKTHHYLKESYPKEYSMIEQKYNTKDNSAKSKGISYPILISPIGEEFQVENIHKFAEEHNLQYQNLHKVLTGKRKHHLNWHLKGTVL